MKPRSRKSQLRVVAFGGLLVALLLAGVFTLGSLDLPFEPRKWDEVLVWYALSTFIVAALLVFGLILARSLLRLWAERRAHQLGARFKTKMVLGAMAISLLPIVFMFYISYALLNRTLGRWFPRPLEKAAEESQKLLHEMGTTERERLAQIAYLASLPAVDCGDCDRELTAIHRCLRNAGDAAWTLDASGGVHSALTVSAVHIENNAATLTFTRIRPRLVRVMPTGVEIWEADGRLYRAGRARLDRGQLVAARRMPDNFLNRSTKIETETQSYAQEKQHLRALKRQMLLALFLFTVLLLFAVTWFAVFLSKQVTVPIQALADGMREVTAGNFDYRVEAQAQDELGVLVRSFNEMTAQLGDSRRKIDQFTTSLQQAVQELERRRHLMEAILENIPTGVLSLDHAGNITRVNPAAAKIFGSAAGDAKTLPALAGEQAARGIQQLMRRSMRMGAASKEFEFSLPGRTLHAAVTVSSLGPRRSNPGFVVVVDDLTELLRAQRAAAWQEVAQRIAHEIKNPLTPIQLSAQRLARYLERTRSAGAQDKPKMAAAEAGPALAALVSECAGLIEREVTALKSLVDEFSQFARFPTARLAPADPNAIVSSALEIFGERLDGIRVKTSFAPGLPAIKADSELLRRVVINLIDNAAEALEGSAARELRISTDLHAESESIEITVADSGHGISPEDKDKLFLPHFSTKDRGTGLGLAIAARIIEEHHGSIRVEDNSPTGSRFIIQLPVAEVSLAPLTSEA